MSASHKMPWSLGFTAPWLPADAPGQGRTPSHHSSPTPEPVSRHWSCPSGGPGITEAVRPLPRATVAHTQLGLHLDPAQGLRISAISEEHPESACHPLATEAKKKGFLPTAA